MILLAILRFLISVLLVVSKKCFFCVLGCGKSLTFINCSSSGEYIFFVNNLFPKHTVDLSLLLGKMSNLMLSSGSLYGISIRFVKHKVYHFQLNSFHVFVEGDQTAALNSKLFLAIP